MVDQGLRRQAAVRRLGSRGLAQLHRLGAGSHVHAPLGAGSNHHERLRLYRDLRLHPQEGGAGDAGGLAEVGLAMDGGQHHALDVLADGHLLQLLELLLKLHHLLLEDLLLEKLELGLHAVVVA